MRKIIFIIILIFLNMFVARNGVFALDSQVNIGAFVAETFEEEEEGGGGAPPVYDTVPPKISAVQIFEITTDSAEITWKTDENASAYLYYGKTISYEIGIIQAHQESITFFHEISLDGLEENTKYYFQLRSLDSAGNQAIKDGYEFTTLPDIKSPPNVNLFRAEAVEGKIILSWENPSDNNFAGIRINRKINFPALDINDGEIIYSGANESFADLNIENRIKYFYTAFSYDNSDNFSSGVIASAIGIKTGEPEPPRPPEPPEPPIPPIVFPLDVENLETVPVPKDKKIIIKWDNPDDDNFKEVEIYKSEDFPILIPKSGELIYWGRENSFGDLNIENEIVYYYTVFTKDKKGNYSSGKTVTGTFKKMPISPIDKINIKDVSFIASDKALLLPRNKNNKIYLFTGSEIGVYYDAKNLPKTLKTILITINGASYILNSDEKKEFYRTKFISPKIAGNYPMIISVLDFKHGKIYQTKAEMVVVNYGMVYEFEIEDYESKSFLEKNILNIEYWILDIFNKKEVLDLEKASVESVKITLYKFDENKNDWQLWEAEKYRQKNPFWTDLYGKYGFMVPNGKYKITVEKEKYHNYSEIVEVKNNIINGEIEMERKVSWWWMAAVILGILIIWRKLRKKKQETRYKNQKIIKHQ